MKTDMKIEIVETLRKFCEEMRITLIVGENDMPCYILCDVEKRIIMVRNDVVHIDISEVINAFK